MRKILFLSIVLILGNNAVFAQGYAGPTKNPKVNKKTTSQQTATKTRSKAEVAVGYSGNLAQTNSGAGFSGDRKVFNGVQSSVTYNVSRYVGIKGDFSIAYRDQDQRVVENGTASTLTRRTTITNALGGLQFKDNDSDAIVQPFAHTLVGVANYRQTFRQRDCGNISSGACGTLVNGWGLAGAFGGGFDVKIAERAGIRLSSDYNPMRIKKETFNNFRFGIGVVFK